MVQPQPNRTDRIVAQAGQYAGYPTTFAGIAKDVFHVDKLGSFISNTPIGNILGVAGVAVSAYSIVRSSWDLLNNPSWGGLLQTGMGVFGMATGLNLLMGASAFGPAGFGFAVGFLLATMTVDAIIMGVKSLFGLGKPPAQEAAENLNKVIGPMSGSTGALIFLAAGAIGLAVGWSKSTPPPAMATITMPSYHLAEILKSKMKNGQNLGATGPVTYVEAETGRIMIATPAGKDKRGKEMSNLQIFSMRGGLSIAGADVKPEGYIHFFTWQNGKPVPNPDVMQSFQTQNSLLSAALSGQMEGQDAMNSILVASSANKYGASPVANDY